VRELDPNRLGDHLDRLYRAAWALTGSREDAEDLVQDTYAKILTRPRFLRGEEDLWYLLRTLKNVFLSQRRTLAARSISVMLDEETDPVEAPSSVQPDQAAESREVYAAISELPDDMREAPSLVLIPDLQAAGATVRAFDPKGMAQARPLLPGALFASDPYDCATGADALVLVTEWESFRALDLARLRARMKQPVVIDLRNIYPPAEIRAHGFAYRSIGRSMLDGEGLAEKRGV